MSDLAVENPRYENDRGPWVIKHPDATPLAPWYVALLPVDLDDPASPVNPGLIAGGERAHEALQFAREVDAVRYQRGNLRSDVAWIVEPLPRPDTPPRWSESGADPLALALAEELAASDPKP